MYSCRIQPCGIDMKASRPRGLATGIRSDGILPSFRTRSVEKLFRNVKSDWTGPTSQFASNMAQTFKPNPSLFVGVSFVYEYTVLNSLKPCIFEDHRRHETKYPDMNCDAFTAVRQINTFNVRMDLTGDQESVQGDVERDYPAFSVGETFFDAVVDALKALKGRIILEVIHDDLSSGLLKIRAGATDSRPAEFPKKFTRMWLSNVPLVFSVFSVALAD